MAEIHALISSISHFLGPKYLQGHALESVTVFITGLPEAKRPLGFKRQIWDALRKFGVIKK